MDTLKLRNKLTNGHDLSIEECEYLESLMDAADEPTTAVECAECHHDKGVDKNGICNAQFFAGGEYLPCLCRCVVQSIELRRNPRVNDLLVALRSIRDKAQSLDAAKEMALSAIQNYIEAD